MEIGEDVKKRIEEKKDNYRTTIKININKTKHNKRYNIDYSEIENSYKEYLKVVDRLGEYIDNIKEDDEKVMLNTKENYKVISKALDEIRDGIKRDDLQKYLCDKANIYLKDLIKSDGIEGNFNVYINDTNFFPSPFVVCEDDVEVMKVDIFNKEYGFPYPFKEDLKFQEYLTSEKSKKVDMMKSHERNIKNIEDIKDNPLKKYKGIKNLITYIIMDKEKFRNSMNEMLDREVEKWVNVKALYEVSKEREDDYIETNKKRLKAYKNMSGILDFLGYENKHKEMD